MSEPVVKKTRPIPGFPFYSDWLTALDKRGYCIDVLGRLRPLDRHHEQPCTIAADGTVLLICIGCAAPFHRDTHHTYQSSTGVTVQQMGRIRIGGFVQMPELEQVSRDLIEQKWKIRPMFKEGLGCPDCREKFRAEEAKVAELNRVRNMMATIQAEILASRKLPESQKATQLPTSRCLHGLPNAQFCAICLRNANAVRVNVTDKLPQPVTPYIDVLDGEDNQEVEPAAPLAVRNELQ
jgi:hypothetical protein